MCVQLKIFDSLPAAQKTGLSVAIVSGSALVTGLVLCLLRVQVLAGVATLTTGGAVLFGDCLYWIFENVKRKRDTKEIGQLKDFQPVFNPDSKHISVIHDKDGILIPELSNNAYIFAFMQMKHNWNQAKRNQPNKTLWSVDDLVAAWGISVNLLFGIHRLGSSITTEEIQKDINVPDTFSFDPNFISSCLDSEGRLIESVFDDSPTKRQFRLHVDYNLKSALAKNPDKKIWSVKEYSQAMGISVDIFFNLLESPIPFPLTSEQAEIKYLFLTYDNDQFLEKMKVAIRWLPHDINVKIFSYFDEGTLKACKRVCKEWNIFITNFRVDFSDFYIQKYVDEDLDEL